MMGGRGSRSAAYTLGASAALPRVKGEDDKSAYFIGVIMRIEITPVKRITQLQAYDPSNKCQLLHLHSHGGVMAFFL